MIEGTVEALGADGVFRGWLCDTLDATPALVQIRLQGQVVAEALACAFRPDLLRSGHGHGHYGFHARARSALAPGVATFVLFLPRHDQGIPVRLTVPLLDPPAPVRVEALLRPEPAWTVDALSPALSCLDLPAQRAAMGTHRFVDAGFQFVLRRWPMDDEAAVFAQAIDEGGMSPEAFLSELLGSRERADLGPDLASPWDATFPFAPVPAKERA